MDSKESRRCSFGTWRDSLQWGLYGQEIGLLKQDILYHLYVRFVGYPTHWGIEFISVSTRR